MQKIKTKYILWYLYGETDFYFYISVHKNFNLHKHSFHLFIKIFQFIYLSFHLFQMLLNSNILYIIAQLIQY